MKSIIEKKIDHFIDLNMELLIVAPFKKEIVDVVENVIQDYFPLLISDEVIANLLDSILNSLMKISRKSAFWEYHCQRKNGEIKWKEFCGIVNVYDEYPFLKSLCFNHLKQFSINMRTFFKRVLEDDFEIKKLLKIENNLNITHLSLGESDTHFEGQTVVLIEFNYCYKVVYKPRNSSGEVIFNEFLCYMNNELEMSHRTYRVLKKTEYSYSEFVSHSFCENEDERRHYFLHFGSLLAILYSLGSVDFHYENVIATKYGPVLIDLESLFSPVMYQKIEDQNKDNVLSTAMLPQKIWGVHGEGVDVSPLGHSKKSTIQDKIIIDEKGFASLENIKEERINLSSCFASRNNEVADYVDDIVCGFEKTYRFIWSLGHDKLLSVTPLKKINEVEIRTILRPTYFYSGLINNSYSPRYLKSSNGRKNYFESVLYKISELKNIYPFEIESMIKGDIPYFQTSAKLIDIYTGKRLVENSFFLKSPLDNIFYRVNDKMSEKDLSRQLWFIKNSINLVTSSDKNTMSEYKIAYTKLDDIAQQLLDDIQTLGVEGGGQATWVTVEYNDNQAVFCHLKNDKLLTLYFVLLTFQKMYKNINLKLLVNTKTTLGEKSKKAQQYLVNQLDGRVIEGDVEHIFQKGKMAQYFNYTENGKLFYWDQILHLLTDIQRAAILKSLVTSNIQMNDVKNIQIPDVENGLGGLLYFILRMKDSSLPTWLQLKANL